MDTPKSDDQRVSVRAPLFLLTAPAECWKCHAEQSVIALGTQYLECDGMICDTSSPGDSDLLLLSNITEMPEPVSTLLAARSTRYRKHASRTAGFAYYTNFCECGANFGDHFLFSEPNGPFFPTIDELAQRVTIETLPFKGTLEFDASWSEGGARLIHEHGRRV